MKAWIVRFVSLYVFDVVVLLLIGAFTPGVRVGWHAFWAAVILTAATLWLKPLIHRGFQSLASRSAAKRSKLTEKLVQYLLVLAVAAIIWILLVVFTGVHVSGFFWFWGWVSPPLFLTIAWGVYDLIDDGIEARAGRLYDRATTRERKAAESGSAPPAPPAPSTHPGTATPAARRDDGLTDEQRRMLDEL
jgi:hypothetical protein